MTIFKSTVKLPGSNFDELFLRVSLLKSSRRKKPVHSVQIVGSCRQIEKAHDVFFDLENGRYVPNFIGKELGAKISFSSFTIDFETTKIKDICKYAKIDVVNLVRYTTS